MEKPEIIRTSDKPIDVLLVAKNDWANTGYRFWRCLLSLGLNAIMFKGNPHVFQYEQQAPVHPALSGLPIDFYPVTLMAPYFEELLRQAHVIHFIASTWIPMEPKRFDYRQANVIVQHGGQTYRQYPERCNHIFNPIANATIIQCPDLLGLGAVNEHLIYYPVDTEKIQPRFERPNPEKIIVGHFPSIPEVKGTEAVLEVINKLKADPDIGHRFEYIGARNPKGIAHWTTWEQNLERLAACDIVIETCATETLGKKFGEWGNTALEAAALGKVVITNSLASDVYYREYGIQPRLYIANSAIEIEESLRILLAADYTDLESDKKDVRVWAEKYHSIEATAQRLWDKVYRQFFGGNDESL